VTRGLEPPASVSMTAVPGARGVYEASYDADLPGTYRFEVEATSGAGEALETLGSARVAVRREDGIAEHFHLSQNRTLLERVASATGGRYFALSDLSGLPEAIRFSQAGVLERQLLDLWNMPINFLLLLLIKAAEWLVRLKWGRL